MGENLKSKLEKIDTLTDGITQVENPERLFSDIDKISDEINSEIEKRKQEILDWPTKEKKAQALVSSDLLVLNLLSTTSDVEVKKKIAQNVNVPTGIMRRFLAEGEVMFIPLAINPNTPVEFLDKIANEYTPDNDDGLLESLISLHPNCNNVLRKKYEFLKDKDGLSGNLHSFLTEFDNLPLWIAKVLTIDEHQFDIFFEHLDSFADYNNMVLDLIRLSKGEKMEKLLDRLVSVANTKKLKFDNQIAFELVEMQFGSWVVEHPNLFHDLGFDRKLAVSLISGYQNIGVLAENIDKFIFENDRDFILEIMGLYSQIKGREAFSFLLGKMFKTKKFSKYLVEPEIFNFFMNMCNGSRDNSYLVDDSLGKIDNKNLNDVHAQSLIQHGYWLEAFRHIEKFEISDYRKLFITFLNKARYEGDIIDIIKKINKFPGAILDNEVASIILSKAPDILINNISNFDGLDDDTAVRIIRHGGDQEIINHINKFYNLTQKTAVLLISINKELAVKVIENIDKFSPLDKKFISALVKAGLGLYIIKNIDKINKYINIDIDAIISEFFNTEPTYDIAKELIKNNELFDRINDPKKIFLYAINTFPPHGFLVVENLNKFKELGYDYLVEKLIKSGSGDEVARNLEKFKNVNRKKIADLLIDTGQKTEIAYNIENFSDVIDDHTQLVVDLIMEGSLKHMDTSLWFYELDKFQNLDLEKIAFALLEYDGIKINKNKINGKWLIDALIENNHGNFILDHVNYFKNNGLFRGFTEDVVKKRMEKLNNKTPK